MEFSEHANVLEDMNLPPMSITGIVEHLNNCFEHMDQGGHINTYFEDHDDLNPTSEELDPSMDHEKDLVNVSVSLAVPKSPTGSDFEITAASHRKKRHVPSFPPSSRNSKRKKIAPLASIDSTMSTGTTVLPKKQQPRRSLLWKIERKIKAQKEMGVENGIRDSLISAVSDTDYLEPDLKPIKQSNPELNGRIRIDKPSATSIQQSAPGPPNLPKEALKSPPGNYTPILPVCSVPLKETAISQAIPRVFPLPFTATPMYDPTRYALVDLKALGLRATSKNHEISKGKSSVSRRRNEYKCARCGQSKQDHTCLMSSNMRTTGTMIESQYNWSHLDRNRNYHYNKMIMSKPRDINAAKKTPPGSPETDSKTQSEQ